MLYIGVVYHVCWVLRSLYQIAAPLINKSKNDDLKRCKGDDKKRHIPDDLKPQLQIFPTPAVPRADGQSVVETIVWHKQVGCFLLQEQKSDKCEHVSYWGGTLNDAENNYDTTQGE